MLTLEVITPKKVMLTADVQQVTLPGELGELGILPGHIRILTSLKSGLLTYQSGSQTEVLAVHFGFAEVNQNHVTVLAHSAETLSELDAQEINKESEELTDRLAKADPTSAEAADLYRQLSQVETKQKVLSFGTPLHH